MSESSIKLREQRRKYCERQKWLCYWCQRPMRWVVLDGRGTLPLDAATLEHLDDRWSPLRGAFTGTGEIRRVAACRECNEKRSNDRAKEVIAQQRARSTARRQGRLLRSAHQREREHTGG